MDPGVFYASGSSVPSAVRIQLGNGDGTFGTPIEYNPPIYGLAGFVDTNPTSELIVVGDFNGDGKVDLAAVSTETLYGSDGNWESTDGSVSVLLGNGDGTFQWPGVNFPGGTPADLVSDG